jgi:hypothetical protein
MDDDENKNGGAGADHEKHDEKLEGDEFKKDEVDGEDTDFNKELEKLEGQGEKKIEQPKRSEKEKAEHTLKNVAARVKELGGDPSAIIGVDPNKDLDKNTPIDTSEFVTKSDLALAEARKLASSESEAQVIMWWVKNKGMSVADAHFMANKNRITKTLDEVKRTEATIFSAGGGNGAAPKIDGDHPPLDPKEIAKLTKSGMVYDPKQKAYIGKKVKYAYDTQSKRWTTTKI